MKLDLGLLADSAHIDPHGKLYILGEFRYITARGLPASHARMALVLRITGARSEVIEGKKGLQIKVVDEDGRDVLPPSPEIAIQFDDVGPAARGQVQSQVVIDLQGFPLEREGAYVFEVFFQEHRLGDVAFHVAVTKDAAQP